MTTGLPTLRTLHVSPVQTTSAGYGFTVTGPNGQPLLLSISYNTESEARDARAAMEKALEHAVKATSYPAFLKRP